MPAKRPEDCDHLLNEYLASGALDAIAELYEEQAVFYTSDRQVLRGRAAIRESFVPLAALKPRLVGELIQVLRAGDDLAMIYNDWSLTASAADGSRIEMQGRAIEVVRRQQDGTWLFAIDDPFARSA